MRFSSLAPPALGRVFAVLFTTAALFVFFACGRSSLEPETLSDGGTVTPRPCSASTCPTGCCDAAGICRTGTDSRACGSAGGRCADCPSLGFSVCTASRVCGRDDPGCGPASCPNGCCSFDEGRQRCLSGTEASACGSGGRACSDCEEQGRACDTATRACSTTRCDATNCKGCCVGDKCLPGTEATTCGANGQQCQSCASSGQTCTALPGAGGRCEGTPNCGPLTCGGGCCVGTTCVAGTDNTACGKGGFACQNCSGQGRICVPDGQPSERTCQPPPTCGPDNCANGCCVGNQCVTNVTPAACGKNGQVCKACGPNETCNGGVCTPSTTCSPANCGVGGTAGCCVGNICAAGTQKGFCGVGGEQCKACPGTDVCQAGVCQPAACAVTCATGCCVGNTCVLGNQDNACGSPGGAQCVDCTQPPGNPTPSCNGITRQCVATCGPATCPNGCCFNGACQPGTTNDRCGTGGIACAACTGGFTCNPTTKICSL